MFNFSNIGYQTYFAGNDSIELMEKLFFYKDEIAIMQERIAEVADKNSSKEVLEQIEHFQNQLISGTGLRNRNPLRPVCQTH